MLSTLQDFRECLNCLSVVFICSPYASSHAKPSPILSVLRGSAGWEWEKEDTTELSWCIETTLGLCSFRRRLQGKCRITKAGWDFENDKPEKVSICSWWENHICPCCCCIALKGEVFFVWSPSYLVEYWKFQLRKCSQEWLAGKCWQCGAVSEGSAPWKSP